MRGMIAESFWSILWEIADRLKLKRLDSIAGTKWSQNHIKNFNLKVEK